MRGYKISKKDTKLKKTKQGLKIPLPKTKRMIEEDVTRQDEVIAQAMRQWSEEESKKTGMREAISDYQKHKKWYDEMLPDTKYQIEKYRQHLGFKPSLTAVGRKKRPPAK